MALLEDKKQSQGHRVEPEANLYADKYKYMPYINLVYLIFLFMPMFFSP